MLRKDLCKVLTFVKLLITDNGTRKVRAKTAEGREREKREMKDDGQSHGGRKGERNGMRHDLWSEKRMKGALDEYRRDMESGKDPKHIHTFFGQSLECPQINSAEMGERNHQCIL